MSRRYARLSVLLIPGLLLGCAPQGGRLAPHRELTADWKTWAERTDYEETPRYDETVAFCRRLAEASPYARHTTFGTSAEGRPLPLLILSKSRDFTPKAAAASGKLLVLVQNCIHPGECEGKDASLELARDMLVLGRHAELLDHVNLVIMPIFGTDGHERFSPYSRINQNGPKEMGWRVTATNLNLNRDYTKADTVEMQAWLRCWNQWRPDFLFDNHTTDGSDCQYDLFYSTTTDADTDPHVARWVTQTLLPTVLPQLEADGHIVAPYLSERDESDLSKGVDRAEPYIPRLSTGYGAICNRPTFLVETHAPKPYRVRVRATYDIMVRTLEELNRRPELLREAIRAADAHDAQFRGAGDDGRIVLTQTRTDDSEPMTYKAVESRVRHSDITGGDVVEYTGRPVDVQTRLYNGLRAEKTVAPPAAYLVPPQWGEVISRLEWHGVEHFRLRAPARLNVETYRLVNVKFAPQSYEGWQRVSYDAQPEHRMCEFAAGTVVVPMNQPRARLAAALLEPDAPDSLVAWGFFNAVLERKEYAEAYVMEPLAQRMLAANPALRAEFEEKLRTNEAFAKNPGARLDFFYQRSPYWDTAFGVYPIARLMDDAELGKLRGTDQR